MEKEKPILSVWGGKFQT